MKKFLLLIALIGITLGAVAQEETNLPQKGDFSVELGFNPFGNNFESFRLEGGMIRARHFITDKTALRVGLGLQYALVTDGKVGGNNVHATEFGLGLGYEWHWFPHRKIDLYAGPSLGFALLHSDRYWGEFDKYKEDYMNTDEDKNWDYYKFSFEVGTGINYYLVKGLYLGAEFGLLVNHIRYRDFQEGVDGPNATTISFEACPSILVGWKF